MIGIGLGVDWGSVSLNKTAVVFETEYQAVLDRGTALGYTLPSYSQQILQNKLLVDLKNADVWAKLDVFYNFANDGSAEFGTLNWKSPTTRQCTFLTSPLNFISNQGIQGTGLGYISTNFNPTLGGPNQYTLNDASRYFYLRQNGVSANVSFDGTSSTTVNGIRRESTQALRINQSTTSINALFDYTGDVGMKSIHRTSSTNVELFNSTSQASRTALSNAIASSPQFILRGSNTTVFATHTVSMYAMGASLVSENTSFVAAYNSYINSI